MPLIELETRIHAPVERVFDLARSIDAHTASAEGSGERAVGGRTTGLIDEGESVTWEARHLGVRQRLTVKITQLERPRLFVDEMVEGAFATLRHVHRFEPLADGTRMRDEFHFTAPCGLLGRVAERVFLTGYLRRFLLARNKELKELAETDRWRRYLDAGDGPAGGGSQGG